MRLAALASDDAPAFVAHMDRQRALSGRDGDPISSPRSADDPLDPELTARYAAALALPVGTPGWRRAWGVLDGDLVVGHVDLKSGALASEQHRAIVGLGLERAYRRAGWGRRLMLAAIDFARAAQLAWLDLGVFSDNAPARALYASLGFVEISAVEDRFRVEGRSICDISMTLRL